jgi:hypothetical protein
MFESVVTALLRAVRDETCVDVPAQEAEKKTRVASNIREAATKGETQVDKFRAAGRQAFLPPPSMWN